MTPSPSTPDAIEAAIDLVCLRQSYEAMRSRAIATTMNAVATVFVLSFEIPMARLGPWLAVLLLWNVLRLVFDRWYRSRTWSDEEIRRRVFPVFLTLMVLPAVTWGALIAVTGFSTSVFVIMSILLAIGGMMAGGAHTAALTPRVVISSVVFSFTPLCLHLLLSGDPVLLAVLFNLAGYIGGVLLTGMRVNNREARASIALRFENQALLARLTVEKESAERANREKTRFLAAASHDVRQPLHALGLFVDTLKEKPLEPEARRLLSSIELAHGSLVSLHEGLLDVSVFDAGGVTARPQVVEVRELLRHLENEASPRARERGLALRVRAAGLVVKTDPALLLRVLRNLVGNALAYTPQGGVLLSVRRRAGHALFQVWDTGIGIPADQFELIFKELHQVGNPARDRTRGLGLGLSIVQRLGTALGFEVAVRSVVGKGSVFSFSLPLATEARAELLALDLAAPATEPSAVRLVPEGTVAIVVDDDGLARAALAAMLGEWGYEVVAARNTEEALEFVGDLERLDLVISDLWLPGRSGLEFLADVGAKSPSLRRVLISGDTAPETAAAARAQGHVFVRKPVRSHQLRAALGLQPAVPKTA